MFDDLIADLKNGIVSFENNKKNSIKNISRELESNVKAETPVDTGKLINSYETKTTKDEVIITNNAKYAPYINDGHVTSNGDFIAGKHMIEKGLTRTSTAVTKEVDELLRKTKLFR